MQKTLDNNRGIMREMKNIVNNQFIQGVKIDWTKISADSYLREIEAIKNVDTLAFHKPITFFVGENGRGNL